MLFTFCRNGIFLSAKGTNINEKTKGILFAVTTALMWSILAIFLKLALQFIDTFSIVWVRFLLAGIFLSIYLARTSPSALNLRPLLRKGPLLATVCLAFNYYGYMRGVEYTSPSSAQLVIQIGPLILALSGIFYFKEKLTRAQLSGLILFVLGLMAFYVDQWKGGAVGHDDYVAGVIWIGLAAIAWGAYAIIQKVTLIRAHPQALNLFINIACVIIYAPATDFKTLLSLSPYQFLILFILGVNTFIAYGCMVESLKRIPANQVSIIITLNPLLTLSLMQTFKYFKWNFIAYENISLLGIAGALILIVGAILVVGKNPKKLLNFYSRSKLGLQGK